MSDELISRNEIRIDKLISSNESRIDKLISRNESRIDKPSSRNKKVPSRNDKVESRNSCGDSWSITQGNDNCSRSLLAKGTRPSQHWFALTLMIRIVLTSFIRYLHPTWNYFRIPKLTPSSLRPY
jgi:hypothetical protein